MNQLTDSSFVFAKVLAPSLSSTVAKQRLSAPRVGPQLGADQPFSCTSSGRAKARDVEAARRFYVGADKTAT